MAQTFTFGHTYRALHVYDEECAAIDQALLDAPPTSADVEAWGNAHFNALTKLRTAFWKDTRTTNSLDHCMYVTVSDMRSWVKTGRPS